jgi:hypothetical protein
MLSITPAQIQNLRRCIFTKNKTLKGSSIPVRVRRSFSLKAKISENEPIFFRFEAKKMFFFSRLFSLQAKHFKKAKTMKAKRKY